METHRIYFEKRCIIICPQDEAALSDPNAVIFCLSGDGNTSLSGTSIIHELVNQLCFIDIDISVLDNLLEILYSNRVFHDQVSFLFLIKNPEGKKTSIW